MAEGCEDLPPTSVVCVPFWPSTICDSSLLLVLASLKMFFSGFFSFPLYLSLSRSTKTTISNFNLTGKEDLHKIR